MRDRLEFVERIRRVFSVSIFMDLILMMMTIPLTHLGQGRTFDRIIHASHTVTDFVTK